MFCVGIFTTETQSTTEFTQRNLFSARFLKQKRQAQCLWGTCRKSFENNGEPWRARTSDPLIKSALTSTPAGYGSYDLLTFVTGCSRRRVQLLLLINTNLSVVLSQVCRKLLQLLRKHSPHCRIANFGRMNR